MQQPSRDKPAHHGSFPSLQYYAIGQSEASLAEALQRGSPESPARVGLCAGPALSQQQLQEILPGTVFSEPALGHLHYHIYPSRRPCQEAAQPGCRSHSRLEQTHQHYPRQQQPRPRTGLDELAKDRSANLESLARYAQMAHERGEKGKNIGMLEMGADAQVSWG